MRNAENCALLSQKETVAARDLCLEASWREFADVPMNLDTERIEASFLTFPAETHREEIWKWFDEQHSHGVAWLLYVYREDGV
ncbi:MAG: hypothetical protein PHY23_01060 [Oscillospiraceae bacterium]|nr:hypothetical protein [Oscillospiraceae bacterium]